MAQSRLEEDTRLTALWAGYAFSKDFREERGHAYMLSDQEYTQRQVVAKQPGTCLNCHASMYATYKRLGAGDLMYSQGVHARSNVSCADCHMPYTRSGAMKISDHHVRSPMLNISRSCQTCHKFTEDELRSRVEQIQSRTFQLRNLALDAVLALTRDIQLAVTTDSTNARIKQARDFQRRAQFYLDFVEAENSIGFHAPGEAARVLGISLDHSRRGQVALAGLSAGPEQQAPGGVRGIGPTPHVGPGAQRRSGTGALPR